MNDVMFYALGLLFVKSVLAAEEHRLLYYIRQLPKLKITASASRNISSSRIRPAKPGN